MREAIRQPFNADPEASYVALTGYLDDFPDDPLAHSLMAAVRFITMFRYASRSAISTR
jgi:hypothetical protein